LKTHLANIKELTYSREADVTIAPTLSMLYLSRVYDFKCTAVLSCVGSTPTASADTACPVSVKRFVGLFANPKAITLQNEAKRMVARELKSKAEKALAFVGNVNCRAGDEGTASSCTTA
jgi:hypothetical protein